MLYNLPAARTASVVHDRPNPGDHSFSDHLREFIASRLDGVDPYAESEEYGRQMALASRLRDRIFELLPESSRSLLQQYVDALGSAHYLEVAILSERAFLDGVRVVMRAVDGQ